MGTPVTSKQWVSSCYCRGKFRDACLVKEKQVTIDSDTKKVLHVKNIIRPIVDPKRRVFITKNECRTYKYKKETELLSNVDTYTVCNRTLVDDLKKILGYSKYHRASLRELCNSPYIYGADVSIESLVRTAYIKKMKHPIVPLTVGTFDIETSVLGDDRINAVTFIADKKVYTAVLDDFMWKFDEHGKKTKATIKDIYSLAQELLKPYIDEHQFTFEIKCFTEELDLIRWIFDKIREKEPDYIGIWNLGYDVPKIIERIKFYGEDPADYFCDPSVPKDIRVCEYREDLKPVQHIVDKWNWFHCSSKSQFVDLMLLYARIRKVKAKEPSYSLDAITTKVLGVGKLKFTGIGGHYEMQTKRFIEYVVYNIFDSMLLTLMEWKNNDCTSLYYLSGNSPLSDYAKQSVMLKNAYSDYCLSKGRVFATTGKNMKGPYDHLFEKIGGAVLKADNTKDIGVHCIVEKPWYEALLMLMCSDEDFSQIYPSFKSGYGISKETKLATVLEIIGYKKMDVEQLMGGIANPEENAVWIGHKFFGLPDYTEMRQLAEMHFQHY